MKSNILKLKKMVLEDELYLANELLKKSTGEKKKYAVRTIKEITAALGDLKR